MLSNSEENKETITFSVEECDEQTQDFGHLTKEDLEAIARSDEDIKARRILSNEEVFDKIRKRKRCFEK